MADRIDYECASVGETVPDGGCVVCPCGLLWPARDSRGGVLFRVPSHDHVGHSVDEVKAARRTRQALDTWLRRKLVRATLPEIIFGEGDE